MKERGAPVRSRRLGPLLGPALLLVAAGVAAVSGNFWTLVSLGLLAVFFAWCRMDASLTQRIVLGVLFAAPFLGVVMMLHPQEVNYFAYSCMLLVLSGVASVSVPGGRSGVALGFLAWFLLSATYSTVVYGSDPVYSLAVIPLGMLGAYLVLSNPTEKVAKRFIGMLLAFAVVEACIGLAQTLLDTPGFTALGGATYAESRNYLAMVVPGVPSFVRMATGTFEHFNSLGALMALSVPVAFGLWVQRKSWRSTAVLVLCASALVATFSRGALLGAGLACCILYLRTPQARERQGIRLMTVMGATLLGGLALYETISQYVAATNNLASRVGAWNLALLSTIKDPIKVIFGAGYGYFAHGFLAGHGLISRLHSAPVQLFSELGVLGAALFVVAVLPPTLRGMRSADSVQNALAAGLVGFLLQQTVDNALFGINGVFAFAVLGLLVYLQRPAAQGGVPLDEAGVA